MFSLESNRCTNADSQACLFLPASSIGPKSSYRLGGCIGADKLVEADAVRTPSATASDQAFICASLQTFLNRTFVGKEPG